MGQKKGKKHYKPSEQDKKLVEKLACWLTHEQICEVLEIHRDTLKKHYSKELRIAKLNKLVQGADALFKNVLKGNVTAQIFFLKTQGGWREPLSITLEEYTPPTLADGNTPDKDRNEL